MIIDKETYNTINNSITGDPPETGGIIGSADGEIIDKVIIDVPELPAERMCSYAPNVDFLNKNIEIWQNEGIVFKGVFHTHFMGVKTLSCADKQYINAIMNAMPDEIKYLYFPVFVLPDRRLVCYKATFKEGKTNIMRDEVKIKI